MIITRVYAIKLIRQGKAKYDGSVTQDNKSYAIITRYDMDRTDHYEIKEEVSE